MAHASFFNKTSLAATQVLSGVSPDGFKTLMGNIAVGIAWDDAGVTCNEGRCTIEMAVNLCARLYPRLSLLPSGQASELYSKVMSDLATSINPEIELVDRQDARAFIVAGHSALRDVGVPRIYAGSKGWQASVSHLKPQKSANSGNPFGAAAAACLAAAQLFRTVFEAHIGERPEEEVSLSLMDYSVNADEVGDVSTAFELRNCVLVGVGAIGNSAIWALARSEVSGNLIVLDPETVDDTNAQRYVLTDQFSLGLSKVELGRRALANTRLNVEPVQGDWASYVSARLPFKAPLAAVALDTASDRCAVQGSLPEHLLNAWTQAGDLGVSRHNFLGDRACLACLYVPRRTSKNEDEIIAEALNLGGSHKALMEVRNALYFDTPLDNEWILTISVATGVDQNLLRSYVGKPLRALYREGVCGGRILPVNGTKVEVPMAFQSALAGLMLAAEIVKYSAGYACPVVITRLNVMRALGPFLSEDQKKWSDRSCICQDADYIRVYRARYV